MVSKRIALTGGIAGGKSTVAGMLKSLGAVILDADQAARDVVQPGSSCWRELRDVFGSEYFDREGQLKRRELRRCIIENPHCRDRLNAILHPAIMAAMERQWEEWRQKEPNRPVIFDIPLLYETDLDQRFDTVILVYVSPEIQIRRLMDRDRVSREEAENTLRMQLPIESKRERAHLIVDNSHSLDHTRSQVEAIWKSDLSAFHE